MIDGTANSIVVLMFAILVGLVLRLASVLTPEVMRRKTERRQGEPLVDYLRRASDVSAEAGVITATQGPRSYLLTLGAFHGLLAMLVVVLLLSPVSMNWPLFLGGMLASYMLAEWLFRRSRAGKI